MEPDGRGGVIDAAAGLQSGPWPTLTKPFQIPLVRRFREVTGTTPVRWLTHQRITRAQQLLETTDLPVERIAQLCGFGTAKASDADQEGGLDEYGQREDQ